MLCCDAVHGGGAEREQWHLLHSLLDFSHCLHYPQSSWAPLVLVPEWVGLCTLLAPVGLSKDLSSPVRLGVSPAAAPTPTGIFSQRFKALFPLCWSPGLRGLLRSPPFVPVYLCTNVGPRGATRCSACPDLCHSESGPLGLSVQMWGRRVC